MSNISKKQIAIIGAGPAGISAALQLKHFGFNVLLFEGNDPGSLLKNAWRVDNYLACSDISGKDLLKKFDNQLKKNSIKKLSSIVKEVDYNSKTRLFQVKTARKKYLVNYLIIASGTKPKPLFKKLVPEVQSCLYYEAFPLFKKLNKTIAIIGSGDAAFDYALSLSKNNQVIIYNSSKSIKASHFLAKEVRRTKNIKYFDNHKLVGVKKLLNNKKLELLFSNQRKSVYMETDYLLAAIGRLSQKDFYAPKLHKNEKRFLKDKKLFLVGDVKNGLYRQVAIAVGDGVKAAMDIFHA